MINKILQDFSSPPVEMQGAPFWAWNGKLKDSILREQIRTMHKMGFGGFFMHSRTGLDTPYMKDEWFHAIDICLEEAEKLGMLAYLYDEDRWPSGAAGGIVTSDDRYKSQKLYCTAGEIPADGHFTARFSLILKDHKLISMRRLKEQESNVDGELYSFYWKYMESSTWYNNAAYLNTIDKESVRKFISVTHEKYAEHYREKFSKSVPAIFTDEPCYIHGGILGCLPWTGTLCEEFSAKYHYDLLDRLPELFFETEQEVSEVRHDFYDLLTTFFSEHFIGQIAAWGEQNALPLCGHLLGEDALSSQTLYIGNAMRCYEKMQIPGVDVLTEYWNIFNTVKQCSSAAHQFGKPYRMTETYGCTGWDFPFYGHKAIGDWQYALGINLRCLHLSWYSMAGEGKRDYPASFLNHSPWYEKYPILEHYFARLGAVLKHGSEIRDLLVIHPIESLWSVMVKDLPRNDESNAKRQIQPGRKVLDTFDSPVINQLDDAHTKLTNLLLVENLDFDFGDEEILSRIASTTQQNEFRVGHAVYRQILIPELKTIRSSTLKLLEEFSGKIWYLGRPPEYVDARPSEKAREVFKKFIPADLQNIAEKISADFRRISIAENSGKQAQAVLSHLSDCDDGFTLFLANTSMEFPDNQKKGIMIRDRKISYPELTVELTLPYKGNLLEFNAMDGTHQPVPCEYKNGKYIFKTKLERLESRLFMISEQFCKGAASPVKEFGPPESFAENGFAYKLSEKNLLVLDHAAWETDSESSDTPEYIILADDKYRSMIGESPRGGLMEQPWHRKKTNSEKGMRLTLTYSFFCDEIPAENCILSMENPEKFEISLNGIPIKQEISGYYLDHDISDLQIDCSLFRRGENKLVLICGKYDYYTNLEALYLRGNFGVDERFHITKLPKKMFFGDWCQQNLANYAGNVTYLIPFENQRTVMLEFPEWCGTLLGIKIDDQEEKLLPFFPFKIEIPAGKHDLSVTVYGHRRNALGPFYLKTKWQERTGPYQFKVYESSQKQLVPCGLLKPPAVYTEQIK